MIIVYQEIKPKPENTNENVISYFKEVLGDTRAFDGNIEVKLYTDQEDGQTLRLISKWESREHYAKYREFRASLGGQLGKIAEVTVMTYNELNEEV